MTAWPLEERVIGQLLRQRAEQDPERPLLHIGSLDQNLGDFNRAVNRMAGLLADLGVGPGIKVALMLPNSTEFLWAWFACAKLGAVYVPINTDYKGDILHYQLAKADVSHLIIDGTWLDRITPIIEALPRLRGVVMRGESEFSPHLELPVVPTTAADSFADREPDVTVRYTDPHAISFTSGTTGPSKGVLASNCHVATFALDWIRCVGLTSEDRLHSCLPMFHAIATWLGFLPVLMTGASMVASQRFSASRFWDEVRAADATIVHGIFSMVPILLKQPPRPEDATQPARRFYIGQRNDAFEARFNCRIIEVFGSTETGIVTYTPLDEERRTGSCGRANQDSFEVTLLDDEDNEVPTGTVGEIAVRPRQPFSMLTEYYNMPDESLVAFRNLWFHTGDSARADEDGFLYFVDRKKDAIRRRGENISSFELESTVYRIPQVLECAAVAVASELSEDEVKVCIVRKPGEALSAEDVWAFCEAKMPRFWVPRYVEFLSELPKTANQKIQKYLLRRSDDNGELHDRGERAGSHRRSGVGR